MSDRLALVEQFDAAEPAPEPIDEGTLDIPIDVEFSKKRFTTLHLQEPKVKHVEKAELELNVQNATPWHFRKYQIALVAAVAGVPIEVVKELPQSTLVRAWGFLRGRLELITPPIGES